MTVITFLLILAVLVFVHELGHFAVAKWAKIRVDEFAIGFPPRLFGFKKGETDYTLNLIPIGGFVKIYGENPDEVKDGEPGSERSFTHQSRWIQAAVLLAGVTMNILFAWFLFSFAYIAGVPTLSEEAPVGSLQDVHVVVGGVLSGSPAEKAGFKAGDTILSLKSTPAELVAKDDFLKVQEFIQTHDESLQVHILRDRKDLTLNVIPESGLTPDHKAIGVALANVGILKLSFFPALAKGLSTTYDATINTALGLFAFIKGLFVGTASVGDVAGPVGIANLVGQASVYGFTYVLTLAAYISINLAVINVLPFPALDGGRLLFVCIEAVIRRPVNQRLFVWTNGIGFALLISLLVFVTYHDIMRLIAA